MNEAYELRQLKAVSVKCTAILNRNLHLIKNKQPRRKRYFNTCRGLNTKDMAKIEQITQLDGILLTDNAIRWLSALQDGNNSMIINYRDLLGDIIAYFGRSINVGKSNDMDDIDDIEFKRFINELSYLRRDLKDLSKP